MNSNSQQKNGKKYVLITGAGSGIGAACAKLFAKNNWQLILLGRDEKKLLTSKELCSTEASIVLCDLQKSAEIHQAVQAIRSITDQLACIVNNSGVFKMQDPKDQESFANMQIWTEQFQVNLFGAVELTHRLLPLLRKQSGSSVVNVASTLGLRPTAETSAYSASKAAMVSWTQSLALATAKDQIRVNVVCPGLVDTPIHAFHALTGKEKEAALQKMANVQPLGRVGQAEEIANSVYFLAAQESAWTTGAVLSVDGGINLT